MSSANLLPIEAHFEAVHRERHHDFPERTVNYFDRYRAIKAWLTANVFRNAGAGLSAEDGNYYTHHDAGHVDDVLGSLGRILGVVSPAEADAPVTGLRPYELYLMLVATLLHDAGNAEGREGHAGRAFRYLREMDPIAGNDSVEWRLIANIAKAHGGNVGGNKDTIGSLLEHSEPAHQQGKVRPRLVAALLRLADEISEGPSRANVIALKKPYKRPESVIHNLYCMVVRVSVDPRDRSLTMIYDVPLSKLAELHPLNGTDVYLVDYIAQRLEKSDRERRYCNRFTSEVVRFEKIKARLEITDGDEILERVAIEIQEEGYPDSHKTPREYNSRFDGGTLASSPPVKVTT